MNAHRALFGLVLGLFLAAAARDGFDRWFDATAIPPLATDTGKEVVDRNGKLLRAYQVEDGRWRLYADVSSVDPAYVRMLVAYEDKRFFEHSGVDVRALLRATWQSVRYQRIVSGASTLTMQTARLLEDSGAGQWQGKLRQTRLALALERKLSKDAILNIYLQNAPFGGNIEGVRAASLAYFGKEPKRLTTAQAALLVALPQSPEARRPDRHSDAAKIARDRVLRRLAGAGVLDNETARVAITEPAVSRRRSFPSFAPHVADRAIAGAHSYRAQTTIDRPLQHRLETLARAAAAPLDDQISLGIMVVDHRTGEVLASVGSAHFRNDLREGFVDMTRARRSPGSTLKPLIYALGFDRGLLHPETLIDDRPRDFAGYAPQNFDGEFRGQLRVREALQLSLNLPVVSVLDAVGPANLTAALRRSGAKVKIPGDKAGLAVALGGLGINLHDLVQLYAGLARGGQSVHLHEQPSVKGDEANRIVTQRSAWYVTDILSGIAPPTGGRGGQIAYKTGTSYGHRDAWAVGYDGAHVVGVWMGRPDGTPVPGAFGAKLAAPLLFDAFARIKPMPDRLPSPPSDALMVSNAELPQPLRVFGRGADQDHPSVAFPPDGARVNASPQGLYVQIRDGAPPFSWLVNGAPLITQSWDRQIEIPSVGRGYLAVTVVDVNGRSARTKVFVD